MKAPTNPVTIRAADPERDAEAIASIYRPAVEASSASFEETAPDGANMARRILRIMRRTPWLVADEPGSGVIGYAYARRHHERAGYRWSVDVSAYVRPDRHGRGVGRKLYDALIPILRRQGYVNVYAGISLPNPASVALHEAVGMRQIGVYRQIGYKLGAWHDVAWYGMQITEPMTPPTRPILYMNLPPD